MRVTVVPLMQNGRELGCHKDGFDILSAVSGSSGLDWDFGMLPCRGAFQRLMPPYPDAPP